MVNPLTLMEWVFKHQDLQWLVWSWSETKMNNFLLLGVVGRGSDTQLQVGENLNYLI